MQMKIVLHSESGTKLVVVSILSTLHRVGWIPALLAHDTAQLLTQVVYKALCMNVKGKYPSAGGNPISTALERVGNLSSPYIKIPQCCHFVVLACTYTVMVTQQPVHLEWHNCAQCSAQSSSNLQKGYILLSTIINVM